MDSSWVVATIAAAAAIASPLIMWLRSRRQDKAATDMSTATAARAIQQAAAGMVEDLRRQISDLKDRVKELETRVDAAENDRDRAYALLRSNGIEVNVSVQPSGAGDAQ